MCCSFDKIDYQDQLQKMVDDDIKSGIYKATEDNTVIDLKLFKSFLYRNFRKYEHYEEMIPKYNQQGQLYDTAKTHKFTNIDEITIDNLKFRPIIAQTGTYTYNAVQVIVKYLKLLYSGNNYIIRNKQELPMSFQKQDPLLPDKEYVSYDVESLFTNVPVPETIDYILQEIYIKENVPKICSKLVMKCLLLKLMTGNTFTLNSNFFKEIDGCAMRGPLSVIFSNIYITKTEEEEVVKPTNPSFYERFVHDIISKKKKHQPDLLFENRNNHHPNIKYIIETMPQKFLDTSLFTKITKLKPEYTEMKETFLYIGHRRFQNVISRML